MQSLCRDCFATSEGDAPTAGRPCPVCRSVRRASHKDLFSLDIAHIDCDAFFAAIEKRDNPELAGKPVIVGGGKRGVVSTCCYIARSFGVRSAMPSFKALRLCPQAAVIKPRMDHYVRESRRVRDLMLTLTPRVEPVSIDEAFLDLSGTSRLHGAPPAVMLAQLQHEIEQTIGITVSVGLASNRYLAKIASEQDKPRGFFALARAEAPEWLATRPVRIISGIGAAQADRLAAAGIHTLGDIQRLTQRDAARLLGAQAAWLCARARGDDATPIGERGERKSISAETTLGDDLWRQGDLEDVLWRLCERTADRAKAAGVEGGSVMLKLKTADFRSISRQTRLSGPTQLARPLFEAGRMLLAREIDGRRFRLIGIGLSDLAAAAPDRLDLADPDALRRAAAERAADRARNRFGEASVTTGRGMRVRQARARRDQ